MRSGTAVLGVLLLGALAAWGPQAHADDEPAARRVLLVLDRGAAAKDGWRAESGNALRLWASLAARGIEGRLVVASTGGDDSTVVDDAPPTEPGLAALARQPAFAFGGPTDPRAALVRALEGGGEGPVDVVFFGPFDPGTPEGEPALAKTIARWNAEAPAGSRVLAVRMDEAGRRLLADARGFADAGRLVIGFREPTVDAGLFSPFGADEKPITATVRILADVLTLGGTPASTPLLAVGSDVADDRVTVEAMAGVHTITLARRPRDGRTATLVFGRAEGAHDVHWLVEPPGPLTFRWDALAPEARLLEADGAPARPFTAVDVVVGEPRTRVLRLLRARTGPAPAWQVRADAGELPDGLAVRVGPEVRTSPEVGESEVRITFTAEPGQPQEARGTLVLSAEGLQAPVRLPFELRVPPGRARLDTQVHPAALPPSEGEPRTTLVFVAENANAPTALQLRATCDGDQARWLTGLLRHSGGNVHRWDLTRPAVLDVGTTYELAFEKAADTPETVLFPCEVALAPVPLQGVELEGAATVTVRERAPRIELVGTPPTFRVHPDGAVTAEEPLVLRLDADGGDGAWLLDLLASPPALRSRSGAVGWQAVPHGRGVWHVVPTGEWSGTPPAIFRDHREEVDVAVTWPHGESPQRIAVPVSVPARWGRRGVVILSLAVLALLLGLTVIGWMRTPPIRGVLLYTVDGLDGTVGRLELSPAGRRTRLVTADANGRLSLATKGDAIAKVRPTRVGGMLEYTDVQGSRERRLLVDGVSLRLGRHLVRYVYGRSAEEAGAPTAPAGDDLLGPEYDIISGKIDALEQGRSPDDVPDA